MRQDGRRWAITERPETLAEKQAFAAVGQARLMMVYQKLFARIQPDSGSDSYDKGHHDQ
ncbi:MAG: hypothetical protein ACLTBV_23155 [Enterocloster bolteae]